MHEFALLLGIVIAESLLLYPRTSGSSGYLWPALKRAWGWLLLAIFVRWVIAWLLLKSLFSIDTELSPSWTWATATGLIAVFTPAAFATIEFVLSKTATTRVVQNALVKILLRLNILTGQIVKEAIQRIKQEDNYDCQNSREGWNFHLTAREANRRLRILYEACKLEIANDRREPELLRHDVDISPGQKFYLLVAHWGRKNLREKMRQTPPSLPPGFNWQGEERRRKVGSKANRRNPDYNPLYSRVFDNEELRIKVTKGEAFAGLKP